MHGPGDSVHQTNACAAKRGVLGAAAASDGVAPQHQKLRCNGCYELTLWSPLTQLEKYSEPQIVQMLQSEASVMLMQCILTEIFCATHRCVCIGCRHPADGHQAWHDAPHDLQNAERHALLDGKSGRQLVRSTAVCAAHWANGVRVVRVYGHSDGYGTVLKTTNPIQPTLGDFSEKALQRYDFAVDAAGKVR